MEEEEIKNQHESAMEYAQAVDGIIKFLTSFKKGKNFSGNNVKGQRKKSDFYETPYSMTRHLLERESFDKTLSVCEPACGDGAMTKVMKEKGFWTKDKVTAYDIEIDFLTETKQYEYIITNPPFSLAFEFVEKAKQVAKKKFALLLPLSYLHGKKRYDDIYSDRKYGLKTVYVFTRYPMLGDELRKDGKYRTGMMVYAWYIFENGYGDSPRIEWIDNNSDVVHKEKKKKAKKKAKKKKGKGRKKNVSSKDKG